MRMMIVIALGLSCSGCYGLKHAMMSDDERAQARHEAGAVARASEAAFEALKAECRRKGGVSIGMTAQQVRASCFGEPKQVNTTVLASGTTEQWVSGDWYVYLRDGRVVAVQGTR